MRHGFSVLLILAASANLDAQTTIFSFECYPPGALPLDPGVSCEGVASNNQAASGVSTAAACGFPTNGAAYALLRCNGPSSPALNVAPGGPFPWPPSAAVTELRVPIPSGSTTIDLDWEYHNAETFQSTYNDGMSVNVVDPTGALVQTLLYVDNWSPLATCISFGVEVQPPGPQTFVGVLPVMPTGCEYLSIICWNEGDNAVAGAARIDDISFNSSLAGCPVPCFSGTPTLGFTSPYGMGSIQVNLGGLQINGTYFLAITLAPGVFPNGWFLGLDIDLQGLLFQLSFGPPFLGSTGGCGGATIGPISGAPSGLPVYAVAVGAIGPGLGTVTGYTPPVSYVIP
jgi:hypothetical protein